MALAALQEPIDSDAFLDWELSQGGRNELVGGVVRPRAGASMGHNTVADNILIALATRLRGAPCRAWRADTRVKGASGGFTYPDVLVSRKSRRSDELFIDDPALIVEVLLPSTANYELTEKRWDYLAIKSLEQLVYVSPGEAKIELVTREADESWRSVFVIGLDASLALDCLDLSLPMAEIYDGIDFAEIRAAGSQALSLGSKAWAQPAG